MRISVYILGIFFAKTVPFAFSEEKVRRYEKSTPTPVVTDMSYVQMVFSSGPLLPTLLAHCTALSLSFYGWCFLAFLAPFHCADVEYPLTMLMLFFTPLTALVLLLSRMHFLMPDLSTRATIKRYCCPHLHPI